MSLDLFKYVMLLIGTADFLMYISYIWGKFGIQKSISISFYDLVWRDRNIFRFFIWILSASIIVNGIGLDTPLFFISGGLLSLVGIFTRIKVRWKYYIHMVGAIGGIISCAIGVVLLNFNTGIISIISILFITLLTFIFGEKKHILWNIEVICFTSLMSTLLYLNY